MECQICKLWVIFKDIRAHTSCTVNDAADVSLVKLLSVRSNGIIGDKDIFEYFRAQLHSHPHTYVMHAQVQVDNPQPLGNSPSHIAPTAAIFQLTLSQSTLSKPWDLPAMLVRVILCHSDYQRRVVYRRNGKHRCGKRIIIFLRVNCSHSSALSVDQCSLHDTGAERGDDFAFLVTSLTKAQTIITKS